MNGPQFLFQSNQFDVDQMSCHCFKVPIAPDPSSSKFTVVTLKCRQLLFELAGVVAASPNIDNNSVTVIGHTSVFSQEKFKAVVDKLKLTFGWQQTITNGIMADCFSYTLKVEFI